jgi:hypothetical protein
MKEKRMRSRAALWLVSLAGLAVAIPGARAAEQNGHAQRTQKEPGQEGPGKFRLRPDLWESGGADAAPVLAASTSAAVTARGQGQEPAQGATHELAERDRWKFTLSPYLWCTGLQGTSRIGPTKTKIDMDFGDVLENLKLGTMLDMRLDRGRWAIHSNVLWADLEADVGSGRVQAEVECNLVIVELDGQYQLTDHLRLIGGARYYYLGLDIDGKGRLGVSASGDEDWIDPIGGLAFTYPLSERWSFGARGDVGGFGVGSDLSWQVWGLFDYRFNESSSLVFGWRHLDWDYDGGRFKLDAHMSGPVIGARFRF